MASVASNDDQTRLQENNPCHETEPENKSNPDYANMAARTVANIKRLQDNVLSVSISTSSSFNNVVKVGQSSPNQSSQEENCQIPPPIKSPLPPSPVQVSSDLSASFNALVTLDPNWQSTKFTLRERNKVMCNNALMVRSVDNRYEIGVECAFSDTNQM